MLGNIIAKGVQVVNSFIPGLECCGSDAYSGIIIMANPALGEAVALLVNHDGMAILSKTSEIYGAGRLLVTRASTADVGNDLIERIHGWEAYTARHDRQINNNPTAGNKAWGLTTII